MKTKLILATVLLATYFVFVKDTESQTTSRVKITIEDLRNPGIVVGKLLMPLGTVVTIRGTIQPLPDVHAKADEDFGWILVDSVNGSPLKKAILLNFKWLGIEKKIGLQNRVTLTGYETGGFEGIPSAALSDMPVVPQTQDFHFETFFLVVKKL